jgi:hypothetical protein
MDRNSDSNQHHIDQPQQQINHWIQQQTTAAVADNSTLHYQQSMPKKLVNILVADSHQPTLHAFNNMADSSSLSYAVVLPPNEETNSSTGTENPGQQGPSTSIQAAHSSPRPSILRMFFIIENQAFFTGTKLISLLQAATLHCVVWPNGAIDQHPLRNCATRMEMVRLVCRIVPATEVMNRMEATRRPGSGPESNILAIPHNPTNSWLVDIA